MTRPRNDNIFPLRDSPAQLELAAKVVDVEAIAKMFAVGMTPTMIRKNTGVSQRCLALLWNDPTFQELLSLYRHQAHEALDDWLDELRRKWR